MKWLVGIDEAGRGPLAGPVAIGVVVVETNFDWTLIPGVGDSKKITPKNREAIFRLAHKLKKEGLLDYQVSLQSAQKIDTVGIVPSIKTGMSRCLNTLKKRQGFICKETKVKLDGALRAPSSYLHQETIIKGDSKELCIGLASILAKVTRDRYMERIATKPQFAPYQFQLHKGYGTRLHIELIKKHGLSDIHRQSFCRGVKL